MLIDKFTDIDDIMPAEVSVYSEEKHIALAMSGLKSGCMAYLDEVKARRLIEALEQALSKIRTK